MIVSVSIEQQIHLFVIVSIKQQTSDCDCEN